MADERVLQVHRTDPLSAGLNEVLGSVGDLHVAFGIDSDHITSAQPTVFGPPSGFFRQVVVTSGDEWAPDFQFARSLAVPWNFAVIADRANLGERRRQSLTRAYLKSVVIWPVLHMRL